MFREEFVKSVEEAEKESGRIFKDREELKEYLESLAENENSYLSRKVKKDATRELSKERRGTRRANRHFFFLSQKENLC